MNKCDTNEQRANFTKTHVALYSKRCPGRKDAENYPHEKCCDVKQNARPSRNWKTRAINAIQLLNNIQLRLYRYRCGHSSRIRRPWQSCIVIIIVSCSNSTLVLLVNVRIYLLLLLLTPVLTIYKYSWCLDRYWRRRRRIQIDTLHNGMLICTHVMYTLSTDNMTMFLSNDKKIRKKQKLHNSPLNCKQI